MMNKLADKVNIKIDLGKINIGSYSSDSFPEVTKNFIMVLIKAIKMKGTPNKKIMPNESFKSSIEWQIKMWWFCKRFNLAEAKVVVNELSHTAFTSFPIASSILAIMKQLIEKYTTAVVAYSFSTLAINSRKYKLNSSTLFINKNTE